MTYLKPIIAGPSRIQFLRVACKSATTPRKMKGHKKLRRRFLSGAEQK